MRWHHPVLLILVALVGPAGGITALPHGGHVSPLPPGVAEEPPIEEEDAPPAGASGEDEPETADADEDKWDVDAPPEPFGPLFDIPLDVREGTWMSVDVSPDGERIVFDLLGDLYVVPIEGGEATSLTSGLAWDMQPRFSPDGERVAFTSDRGGGDNVWVIDFMTDGAEPQPVTEEGFRLLNSPVWTPEGDFIAARKHFTSRRSLGAGEIWLYHRSGGGGLQMVEKANDQKDLGEPAFSPDGRYLYFSQDTTSGGVFQYNKDPNGQIYEIRRLDRETGGIEDLVGGPGGAVRPTPSPDGHLLAFVRRVRNKSVLFLKDLTSGEEWPLTDRLDRDMQETWAIHGVYPTIAWTPDSRSLVFWGEGRLWRLDVATRALAEIPFHVVDRRAAAPAARSSVEVHPETFEVKMLRWVEVSPAGDRVVFGALGRIWLRDLPDGEPRRLTTQEEHFEYYPTFSRDGRWVAYVSWDDAELGAVRVAPAAGGAGRTVTRRPGHYAEPTFSPDGGHLVYRRLRGGGLTSPTWSDDPGIYRVAATGGEGVRVAREGVDPHFGGTSDRLYLLTFAGEGRRALVSVALDGPEDQAPREHLKSDNATEIRISPDGRWVAFREGFHGYVAPFVATGKAVEIGPQAKSLPVRRVTQDAGEYLHWSGDSSALHWALGSELSILPIAAAFDFLDGGEDRQVGSAAAAEEGTSGEGGADAEELPVESRSLGWRLASDRPQGTIALHGARLITMRDEEVIPDGTVLIEGNRIREVGPSASVVIPRGAHRIDASGKTIIPGLIDVHWHGPQGAGEIVPEQNWELFATLAFGVTTVHDPSNDTSTIFTAAEMARHGLITAPRIFSTGTILYGAKAPFKAEIDSLDDAQFHLARLKAVGAFSVKSYNQPRREQRQQVLAAARELGMLVLPEGGSLFQHNMTMVVDGHTGIEHSIPVARIYEDVRQLWAATEVGYTPTLVVGYGGLWGENYWYAKTAVWDHPRLLAFVPREVVDRRSRRRTLAPDEEWGHFANARAAAELAAQGVGVQVGAHGQREGLGAHWELWMLEQGGLSPHQALAAATLHGARYLGLDGELGSLAPGKLADLVVLGGDPLADLRNSQEVELVVLNGRVYDGGTLRQLHPRRHQPEPFYWQREPGAFSP